jgi:hypothetical protein
MPEQKAVHPGSFVGDSIEEWKKLPTWGKVAAVAVVGVVVYLAIRARNAAATTNGTATTGSTTTSPQQQGLPSLPYGTTLLSDPNGNPQGFVGPAPATPPPPSDGGQGAPPPQNPSTPFGSLPSGFKDILGFVSNVNGQSYSIVPGSNGRIWAVAGSGYSNQQLLNMQIGPNMGQKFLFYQGQATNTQSAMNNPNHYTQNATPHLPAPSSNAPGGGPQQRN